MLRLIVRRYDVAGAVNVGAPVDNNYKTFDVDLPEIEAYLTEHKRFPNCLFVSELMGVEILEADAKEEGK